MGVTDSINLVPPMDAKAVCRILPKIVAMAVESVKGTVYVYEDAWNGALLFTDQEQEERPGRELLMIAWPAGQAQKGGSHA